MDLSPDSLVHIKGSYTLEIKDGWQENALIYHIQAADIEISGSRKMLLLSGENITIEAADGRGQATFFGNGTYSIEDASGVKKEEKWASNSLFEESNGPGEPMGQEKQIDPEEPGKKENKVVAVGTNGPETIKRGLILVKRTSYT